MVTRNILEKRTKKFFKEFFNEDLIKNQPKWSKEKWSFEGTLPNNDKRGLYAHLKENEVTYIGLGIGKSYDNSGIGSRVSKYWKKSDNYSSENQKYIPTVESVDAIITLPFDDNNFYLAAALEVYLIKKLKPMKNKTHSR